MIYATLRMMGLTMWLGCALALIYQSMTWVFTANWPALSVMDITGAILGLDSTTLMSNLPFQAGLKTVYLFMTTDLSLGLWCAGTAFFAAAFLLKVVLNK